MRDQLEQRMADLRKQVGMQIAGRLSPEDVAPKKPALGKRHMSASARRRISLAQKKRWAAQKATSGKAAAPKPRKRVISAAGKARIAAAAKKRWAAFRKAQQAAQK
jgi:hypothetical protein